MKDNKEKKLELTAEQLARKEFLDKTCPDKITTKRGVLFNLGKEDGYPAAVCDYMSNKVDLSVFDVVEKEVDKVAFSAQDQAYELGFEIGYLRKLAELAVY